MALHLQDQGSWKKADEVWVNDTGTWKRCQEVYIRENDGWKTVLYESGSAYFTEDGSFTVPFGVYSLEITIAGGAGGAGGGDGGAGPVDGGNGMSISSTLTVEPGDVIEYVIGSQGGDGVGYRGSAAGGVGGTGYSNGGTGGTAGSVGSSGGGGGGGGSSSIHFYATNQGWNNLYMVAAGGSGAGGRGNRQHYSVAQIHGKDATQIQNSDNNLFTGGNGINCPCPDGGAGGGGGAGTSSTASGGLYYGSTTECIHYDSDGLPGEAGISYFSPQIIVTTTNNNTGDGYVSITW